MSGLRPIIDGAVAAVIAEHPKYFTERGIEKAQSAFVRKIMSALVRGGDGDKPDEPAAPAPEPAPPSTPIAVETKSREGRAYINLRQLAGAPPPFRMGDGRISVPPDAQRESVYALADLPKQDDWQFISEKSQIAAWLGFFGETLTAGTARQRIDQVRAGVSGIHMPWPWPPSATGKIYTVESEQKQEPEADA